MRAMGAARGVLSHTHALYALSPFCGENDEEGVPSPEKYKSQLDSPEVKEGSLLLPR